MMVLWVSLAGAAGTGARFLLSTALAARYGAAFPLGTLTVNVPGSLAAYLTATVLACLAAGFTGAVASKAIW